ncbi:6-carboxytetrahydropterin synthase QueD [bacterium]|nr:6-carboxytetrahydropterin synthase QueD [bacterium]
MSHIVEMCCDFHLEVGHFMPNFPEGHPNRRLHGHSYEGSLFLKGPVEMTSGVLLEMDALKVLMTEVVAEFDHRMLNDIEGLEIPTTENFVKILFKRFKEKIRFVEAVELRRPTLGMKVLYRG